jgi:hypothetical protein
VAPEVVHLTRPWIAGVSGECAVIQSDTTWSIEAWVVPVE